MHHEDETRQEESFTIEDVDENLSNREESTSVSEIPPHGHAGAAIRILRVIRQWSQGKLADEAKVHLNTVSRFEADPSAAETDTLRKLARALAQTPAGVNLLAEQLTADGQLDLVKLVRRATPTEGSGDHTLRGDTLQSGLPKVGIPSPGELPMLEMSTSGRRVWPLLHYVLQDEALSEWLLGAVKRQIGAEDTPGKTQRRKHNG